MERTGTPISTAIKRKLHFINRKAEGAWHSEWQALYDQIDPANLGTIRTQIEIFVAVTIQLVKRKAESMIATTREVLSKIEVDENLQVELESFILNFFDDSPYIQRLTRFVEAVGRKFKSFGLAFKPEKWRIDLIESLFQAGIKNALREARGEINADFVLFRARTPAKHSKESLQDSMTETERDNARQNGLSDTPVPAESSERGQYYFILQGEYWDVGFQGKATRLRHIKGLSYITHLLGNPDKDIPALELSQLVNKPDIDEKDREQYGNMTQEQLAEEGLSIFEPQKSMARAKQKTVKEALKNLEEARRNGDPLWSKEAQREYDEAVNAIMRKRGAKMSVEALNDNRARINAQKRITAAYSCMKRKGLGALVAHLRKRIKTGSVCSYTSHPENIDWYIYTP
jgi:hypothetical protein